MVKIMRIIIVYVQRKLSLRGAKRRGNLLRLLHFVRNDIFEDVNFLGRSLKYSPRKRCGSKPHPFLTGFTPLENPSP